MENDAYLADNTGVNRRVKLSMKNSHKTSLFILFVPIMFIISGCGNVNTSTWNQPFPAGDILFQSNMWGPFVINVIQADGTNHQLIDLPQNFVRPVWSENREILYALSAPWGVPPYEGAGYPAYWNIKTGYFQNCVGDLPLYFQIEPNTTLENQNIVLLNNFSEIALFDLDTCKKINTVFDVNDQEVRTEINGFSYNPETLEIVFGEIVDPYGSPSYHINILNLNTGEKRELASGFFPMWSPDGTEIAIFGLDGLYVLTVDENKVRKLIDIQYSDIKTTLKPEDLVSPPRWSADGEWLVFHLCGDHICTLDKTTINKIRVDDGFQVKLFTGGKYPAWMPGK